MSRFFYCSLFFSLFFSISSDFVLKSNHYFSFHCFFFYHLWWSVIFMKHFYFCPSFMHLFSLKRHGLCFYIQKYPLLTKWSAFLVSIKFYLNWLLSEWIFVEVPNSSTNIKDFYPEDILNIELKYILSTNLTIFVQLYRT